MTARCAASIARRQASTTAKGRDEDPRLCRVGGVEGRFNIGQYEVGD
jgi:hypothetical protein